MRLLYPIIGVPISDMDFFRDYLTMGDWITSQLIRHDLPELSAMISQQTLEKPFCSGPISPGLKVDISYFTVLVNSPPQIVLLAVDLHKDFITVDGIAAVPVLALHLARMIGSEFDTPEADRL